MRAILSIAFSASCVYTLPRIHDADSRICPDSIEPKALSPVNKALIAVLSRIAQECRSAGS
jgi:hypothetical protein